MSIARNPIAGTVTGTGAAINVALGWTPKYVKVFNPSDAGSIFPTIEWFLGMAAASGFKTKAIVDNGVTANKSSDYVTANGISVYNGSSSPVTMSGTVAVTANSAVVTGTTSKFLSEVKAGDVININGNTRKVASIASDTSLSCTDVWPTTASGAIALNMNGIAPGFTIGADVDVNAAGEAVFYIAVP